MDFDWSISSFGNLEPVPGCDILCLVGSHLVDHLTESTKEVERDFSLVVLLIELDELTNKVRVLELHCI